MAISPALVAATNTVALPAISDSARAAAVPITLAGNRQSVDISLEAIPTSQKFGRMGSVFIDNQLNGVAVTISFPDTGMVNLIPANSATYVLAITGALRFTVFSPVVSQTNLVVLVLNVEVNPTGVQPIAGTVVITAGTVAVSNQGPINGLPVTRSANFPAAASIVLVAGNVARKFLLFAMPQTSDGWVNFNGGAAAPNAADCFYMQPGEKFLSTGYVPQGQISLYVTAGGEVPAIEG